MNPSPHHLPRRWSVGMAALLVLLPLAAGCAPPLGTVSGRVLYKDKPVPGGWVMFMPTAGGATAARAPIDEQGRYELTVPAGEVQILVDNQELAPLEKSAPPPLPQDFK